MAPPEVRLARRFESELGIEMTEALIRERTIYAAE
jgi:hypothetical protein